MPFAGLFAKIAWGALFSRAKSNAVSDWQALSPKVKHILLGIVAAVALFFAHQWYAHKVVRVAVHNARAQQKAADDAVLAQTVANYRAAAVRAHQLDVANVQRVQAKQQVINERTDHDFQARIADARARAGRLQSAQAAADSGSRGGAHLPNVPSTASVVADLAAQDGFPLADRLTATEQAIQLDELIKWVKAQAAIDPNERDKQP